MNNEPNRHTVLGTLIDRAVCMPYAKPQVLRGGYRRFRGDDGRWQTGPSIGEDIAEAASFLVRSLWAPDIDEDWSSAALALDPAGPWWPKARNDFIGLNHEAQSWVLDHLEVTADRAAVRLQHEAEDRGWSWMWSQPAFASPGKLRPSITQPDLIVGTDWKRCSVIDLKTTSRDVLRAAVKSEHKRQFASWVKSLQSQQFIPVRCQALVVSTVTDVSEWVEVPMPDPEAD